METMTKTLEQKINALEQKLAIAKELGLKEQVSMIHKEIKIAQIEQKCTYEEVTPDKCRDLLCPKTVTTFKAKRINRIKFWEKDWEECQERVFSTAMSFLMFGSTARCEKIVDHDHVKQATIIQEKLGTEANRTPMPMAALIRMKEAKEKAVFDSFEVWRPETDAESKIRLEDPWLVGVVGARYFKLCDWR